MGFADVLKSSDVNFWCKLEVAKEAGFFLVDFIRYKSNDSQTR